PREFKFSSLQTVPAPLHDERFSKKSADQSEWQDSVQVQPRIAGMRIRQIVPADQLWDQRSTAPQILSINARLDVVPVEKSQKVSMAVAANPCSPGIFTWKKCSSTGEIRTHWRNSPRARQFFVAIHTG